MVVSGPWFTLRDATVYKGERTPMKVDGDALFHREAILFMQVLPGDGA